MHSLHFIEQQKEDRIRQDKHEKKTTIKLYAL